MAVTPRDPLEYPDGNVAHPARSLTFPLDKPRLLGGDRVPGHQTERQMTPNCRATYRKIAIP